jgi:hypothetical protein
VRILFVMRHPAALRSLSSVLRLLDERGNHVHLVFDRVKPEAHKVLQQFADQCRALTFGSVPGPSSPGWTRAAIGWDVLARRLRVDSDYLRYLEPVYAEAPALRARAEQNAHPLVRRAARVTGTVGPRAVRLLRGTIELVERCLEPPPHIVRFLADFEPDVVVVTHLARDSVQVDYVRAAKRLGLHTVYPVFSWDNLTNKGLVHELAEVVLVWNELQAAEAVELQGIPRDQVRVLGAWSYDHWFEWQPSRSRAEFCAQVALRADRPFILYVCSSGFVARDEVTFVRRWLQSLRDRGGVLAEAGVLVRPHPRNSQQWAGVGLDDPHATVWPRLGEEPLEVVSRQNYFDSIHHAAAVVGINTSAQIESAIVGRPVHTVLADQFRETQQGTLHFQYLKADGFGHLHVGRTMQEHLDQLDESLRGRADDGRNERFVQRFVRPLGRDVAASPLYVQAVEELSAQPSVGADRGPALAPVVRLALAPVAATAARKAARRRKQSARAPDELKGVLRRIRRQHGSSVLVCPWLGRETAELLFWIPFLRWCQTGTLGLRDRLVVVARASSLPWYAGIGARRVSAEDVMSPAKLAGLSESFPDLDAGVRDSLAQALGLADPLWLTPSTADAQALHLAGGDLGDALHRARLEFEPLAAPGLPEDVRLPEEFVAVRFGGLGAGVASALAERSAVVELDGLDRSVQAGVLGRTRGFVGGFGVEACLALMLGRPAVVLIDEGVEADELRVASHLPVGQRFGRLHVLEALGAAEEAAEQALRLVDGSVGALAAV